MSDHRNEHAAPGGLRLARTNYTVRTVSFAYCFLVIGLVLLERKMGMLAWGLLALQFLIYPQLAFLHAMAAKDARRAELRNLYADSLALGAWVAMLGFPTWIAYASLFSILLNTAVTRGWVGAACATVCFGVGALAWVAPMGFMHYPGTSDLVTAMCFLGSLAYTAAVGLVVQAQNRRLRSAREQMREGERRYRLITEHAADLVGMVDCNGRWLYASPSYGRLLCAEDLARGADAFRRVHEEDQLRVRGAVQVLLKNGMSGKVRLRLNTKIGELRRLESMVYAVRDEHGLITGSVMASRDITELADRDEQLEVAGLAFERMAEAMMITNAAGRILTVNRAFTRITGHEAADVLGEPESRFRSGMQAESFYDDIYATVLRTGQWRGSTWCQRRDGTVYREWRSVSAVRDADSRVTHYVVLFGEMNGQGGLGEEWPAKSA